MSVQTKNKPVSIFYFLLLFHVHYLSENHVDFEAENFSDNCVLLKVNGALMERSVQLMKREMSSCGSRT